MSDKWAIGDEVVIYRSFSGDPSGPHIVEKIHKNGNLVVNGMKFKPFCNDFASQTGNSYSRASIRRISEDIRAHLSFIDKRDRIRRIASWVDRLSHDEMNKMRELPDDAIEALLSAIRRTALGDGE